MAQLVWRQSLLWRWQPAGGCSIPRWSVSKTQDRRFAERQRARTKKNIAPSKFGNVEGKCFHIYWSFRYSRSSTSPMSRGYIFGPWNRHSFWRRGRGLPCLRPLVATSRLRCYVWRWCVQLDSSNTIQDSIWVGRQTGPQGGTGFRMLRAQFWTLAQSKCMSKGVQKWTLLGSKVVPPGGSVFGPFILSDVLKLCRLPCAKNFKLEATWTQTASAAGILNCIEPIGTYRNQVGTNLEPNEPVCAWKSLKMNFRLFLRFGCFWMLFDMSQKQLIWKNVFEAWELFWSSLRSLRTFECHCVLLCSYPISSFTNFWVEWACRSWSRAVFFWFALESSNFTKLKCQFCESIALLHWWWWEWNFKPTWRCASSCNWNDWWKRHAVNPFRQWCRCSRFSFNVCKVRSESFRWGCKAAWCTRTHHSCWRHWCFKPASWSLCVKGLQLAHKFINLFFAMARCWKLDGESTLVSKHLFMLPEWSTNWTDPWLWRLDKSNQWGI